MSEGSSRAVASRRRPSRRHRVALPGGRRGGVHLPHGGGLLRAADRAAEIGASAFQIFTDNPTSWRRRSELPPELPEFRARLAARDMQLTAHAAYLVNLAGPDEELFRRSVDVLTRELATAPAYGASFVNVHVGSHRGSGVEAGVARVVEGVQRVLAGAAAHRAASAPVAAQETEPVLVLENGSGGGDAVGARLAELEAILIEASRRGVDGKIRFCLDTAHLWGAGYDIGTAAGADAVVDEFDRRIGLDRLALVHFNDSAAARGSRHDRHTHIGAGQIGLEGMGRLAAHPALARATFILETPATEEGYDLVNLSRMADLGAGRPLRRIPGELPSGRPRTSRRRETAA